MKLVLFCGALIIIVLYFIKPHINSQYSIRAVYTIPELLNIDIEKKIINEFSNIAGILNCKTSIESKNVLLDYNDEIISHHDIIKIFYKWGCSISDVYYDNLFIYQE